MSLLDFLLDLEDKEIKFYLQESVLEDSFFRPSRIRYKFIVIIDGSNYIPVHVLLNKHGDRDITYITIIPFNHKRSEISKIRKSLKELILQLFKDYKVKEKLNNVVGLDNSDKPELLFKFIPKDGEIVIY